MLTDSQAYGNIGLDSYNLYNLEKEIIEYVLGKLGYTPSKIKKVLYNCYTFERAFSSFLPNSSETKKESYRERGAKSYMLENLQKLQGKFPLTQLLEAAGVSHSDTFRVLEPAYVHFLGTYY